LAITSREQWAQFWKKMRIDQGKILNSSTLQSDDAPETNFKKYTLIVAAAGAKPTAGFTIAIQDIVESGDVLRVSIIETRPGRDCGATAMSSSPFLGAEIPVTSKKVIFDISTTQRDCAP
jgi:hypothetical protein